MDKNKKEVSLYENLIAKFKHYYPNDYGLLTDVFEFAKNAHNGQKRASKEEYFIHPCYVAEILVDMGLDSSTVCAALLHDVVEDTDVSREQIENKYGKDVAMLVESVTKLDSLQFKSREEEQAENIRKMLFAMAKDMRVIMIKLADRLHNMRTLSFLPPLRQQTMAQETMDIYAPIASHLGLSHIKCELEDLCFKHLEPEKYDKIVAAVALERSERQEIVERVMKELRQQLSEIGIKGEVSGRPKHIYSIYRKMIRKNKTFDQIYDLTAVRVVVESVKDCYAILGTIHTMWKPIPGRFKDYIAVPKANMYQSLHTSIVTDFGKPFEIQIRTFNMHRTAEYGVAAHWKYKEGIVEKPEFARISWIDQVASLDLDSNEFLESLKNEFTSGNEIFVFTPVGDVKRLQADATPLDFAYAIHSEVGNRCVGAKVNSKMAPLSATLSTGDVVEIITSAASKGPGRDWLKIVKTASAKAKIKQYLKREMKDEYIKTGKAMLELDAKRKGYAFSALTTTGGLNIIYAAYSFSSVDEIYASVGFGSITGNQVLTRLIDYYKKNTVSVADDKPPEKALNKKNKGQSVIIRGFDDLLIRFAKCCNPLPGDDIIGFVSRGRGVSVHRADCPCLKDFETERIIRDVSWSQKAGASFTGALHIAANDKNGLVAQITKIINNLKFSIVAISARVDKTKICNITVEVKINKADDLNVLIDKLKAYPPVLEVQR
jgi:GTP pyrophosphokinase